MRTQILEGWHLGIRLQHIAHSRAASRSTSLHRALGIPVVIVTTVVGTTVFSSLGNESNVAVTIVVGLLSISAAVLSSLQTFLNYSGSAEKHYAASIKYGMLRRELEQFLDDTDESKEVLKEFMENFRIRWDQIDQESPPVTEKVHDEAHAHLRRSLKARDARLGTKSADDLEQIKENMSDRVSTK